MNNIYYTYIYLNPLKGGKFNYGKFQFEFEPFYVGKGKYNRSNQHIKESHKSTNRLKVNILNKIKSAGLTPIIIKLYDNITEHSSIRFEKYLIKLIGRRDLKLGPLSNLTSGGDGISGHVMSNLAKSKISKASSERWKDLNYKNKMKMITRGENNSFYGRTHSAENKKIFSETAKKTFTNIKQTTEHINKRIDKIKGENNGMFGTNVYERWVEKYGEKQAKIKNEEFLNKHIRGVNNPMYGKLGKNHPSCKEIILIKDGTRLSFNGNKECEKYFKSIEPRLSYNTLRQYSSKNIEYSGYKIERFKLNLDI